MDAETYRRAVDIPNLRGKALQRGRALDRGEIAALFGACAEHARPAGRRDAALLAVLYGCGLRRAEAVGLVLGDLDLKRSS